MKTTWSDKTTYVFYRYKNHDVNPDLTSMKSTNFNDAIFEFVYQKLGYQILKVTSDSDVIVEEV